MPAEREGPPSAAVSAGPTAADPLERLADLADALGAGRAAREARALAERVAEGRFNVACVGQFKRGKSTLLNALVGRSVLPTGVIPVTATPTILRWGPKPAALVRLADGETRRIELGAVADYVTEERNPANARGVDAVEMLLPAPLLYGGLCLVDTPGLGSVFDVATGATHAFVPHIDAALLVLGADPPISADEAELAAAVSAQVPDVIVLLAKADRVPAAERAEAARFAARVLEERTGRAPGPILEVSSTEALAGERTRDWGRLVERLHALSARSGRALVRAARERAVRRLGAQLLSLAAEERSLLAASADERERRLEALRRSEGALEERLRYLSRMLAEEEERLADAFRGRGQRFLAESLPPAVDELARALGDERTRGPAFRRRAAELARDVARRRIEPWLAREEAAADEAYGEVAARLVDRANGFLDELAASERTGLRALPHALGPEPALRGRRRFSFNAFPTHFVSPGPLQWLFDTLAPPRWLRARVQRQAAEFLQWLLEANAVRVRSDLAERVAGSRRALEGEIRAILEDARAWTGAAIERAQALHAAGLEATRPELARLETIEGALRTVTGEVARPS